MTTINELKHSSVERINLESMIIEVANKEYEMLGGREIIDILINGTKGVFNMDISDIKDLHKDMFPEKYSEEEISEYELPRVHRSE